MANETRYYDTPYTFISPVRHFKSNDPYYYEVDNIPIKQLEESQSFLKIKWMVSLPVKTIKRILKLIGLVSLS